MFGLTKDLIDAKLELAENKGNMLMLFRALRRALTKETSLVEKVNELEGLVAHSSAAWRVATGSDELDCDAPLVGGGRDDAAGGGAQKAGGGGGGKGWGWGALSRQKSTSTGKA